VDKLVSLIWRFQPQVWIAQIVKLLAAGHEAKTRADQQHPVDRALAILAPGSLSHAMKAAAGFTGQPAFVLCLATEFRAIGIGEFYRQPVEACEIGPSRNVEDMLMDGGLLEALHETYLVGMKHGATLRRIFMIIN
jgi:hypothetical protein